MKDLNGCSTCPAGQEIYETFFYSKYQDWIPTGIEYQYRTTEGVLFSTVTTSLEVARMKRDNWLKERELKP